MSTYLQPTRAAQFVSDQIRRTFGYPILISTEYANASDIVPEMLMKFHKRHGSALRPPQLMGDRWTRVVLVEPANPFYWWGSEPVPKNVRGFTELSDIERREMLSGAYDVDFNSYFAEGQKHETDR